MCIRDSSNTLHKDWSPTSQSSISTEEYEKIVNHLENKIGKKQEEIEEKVFKDALDTTSDNDEVIVKNKKQKKEEKKSKTGHGFQRKPYKIGKDGEYGNVIINPTKLRDGLLKFLTLIMRSSIKIDVTNLSMSC